MAGIVKQLIILLFVATIVACGGGGGGSDTSDGSGDSDTIVALESGVALESVLGKTWLGTVKTALAKPDTAKILGPGDPIKMSFKGANTIYGFGVNPVRVTSWEYAYGGDKGTLKLFYINGHETIEMFPSDSSGLRGTFTYKGILYSGIEAYYTGTYVITGIGERAPLPGSQTPPSLDSAFETATATALQGQWPLDPGAGGLQSTSRNGVVVDGDGNTFLQLTSTTNAYIGNQEKDTQSALVKLDFDGQLDPSFNGDGLVVSGSSKFTVLDTDSQGSLYAVALGTEIPPKTVLHNFSAQGTPLASFGSSSDIDLEEAFGAFAGSTRPPADIEIDDSGNIYLMSYQQHDSPYLSEVRGDVLIMKLSPEGAPVPGFNTSGSIAFNCGDGSTDFTSPEKLAVDSIGNIYVGGICRTYEGSLSSGSWPFVAKVTRDGELDPGFGNAGVLRFDSEILSEFGDLIVTASDTLYVTGTTGTEQIVLARLTETGQFDTNFANQGYVTVSSDKSDGFARGERLAIDAENNVYVLGRFDGKATVLAYANTGELLYELPVKIDENSYSLVSIQVVNGSIYLLFTYSNCVEWSEEDASVCTIYADERVMLMRYAQ